MTATLETRTDPDPPDALSSDIARVLRLARRRMRTNRALAVAGPALVTLAVVVLTWTVVTRLAPVPRPGPVALAGLAAAALLVTAAAMVVRITDSWAAWAADRWLGEPETFATAVALSATPGDALAAEHLRRADRRARDIDGMPGRPRVPVRMFCVAAVALLLAAGIAVSGDPQRAARERAADEQAATAAQAEALREAATQLEQQGQPAASAAQQLEQLAEQLDGADLDTALERLDATRDELATADDSALAAQRTALAGLERALAQQPLAAGGSAQQQLDQLASDLGAGDVDDARRDLLADELEQLAAALEGQPEVAEALGQAAGQLRAGGAGAAGAVGAAATAVDAAGQQLAAAAAGADAADAVDSAASALRGAAAASGQSQAQTRQAQQGQGQQGQQGQGQGQGQGGGQGQGQGSGQGPGQGGGGGGQGATASGQQRDGRSGTGGGPGQDDARTQPEGELDDQTVYDPDRARGSAGEDLAIQGRDTGGRPETTRGTSQGPGQRNNALVPYTDVLAEYSQQATQTVERPGYPVALRDVVRDYFGGLAEPGERP